MVKRRVSYRKKAQTRSQKRQSTKGKKTSPAKGKTQRDSLFFDRNLVKKARALASSITLPIQKMIREKTTVSIERATLRLLGVTGSVIGNDQHPMPYVNIVVDKILRRGILNRGVLTTIAHMMDTTGRNFMETTEGLANGTIPLAYGENLPKAPTLQLIDRMAKAAVQNIIEKGRQKARNQENILNRKEPLRYVIVATGNIKEDAEQAKAAVEGGADIIAVIRSTAQSLLDYVPEGITTVGFGGTFATQENFHYMRQSLNDIGKEKGRYIYLTNYSSGLCMPEIAAMAALEDLDMLLNDAMYGILFRDINMKRTLIDQYFSRLICSANKIYIQTGEDNYLTTADAFESSHQVLASQFINECFAVRAGLTANYICLGHAFEMAPNIEDQILWEIAQAQVIRQIFPESPIKYMPPTKHKTGDFFWSNLYDGMFNLVGILTGQSIQLLGMATESLHNPKMQDRYWSLKNANYVFNAARHLGEEVQWRKGGRMEKRVGQVLQKTLGLLKKINQVGLLKAISNGWFADVSRSPKGGKGLEGVIDKGKEYWNPVWKNLENKH